MVLRNFSKILVQFFDPPPAPSATAFLLRPPFASKNFNVKLRPPHENHRPTSSRFFARPHYENFQLSFRGMKNTQKKIGKNHEELRNEIK